MFDNFISILDNVTKSGSNWLVFFFKFSKIDIF
jgi:hypothetical protein